MFEVFFFDVLTLSLLENAWKFTREKDRFVFNENFVHSFLI